ncbi:MAG: sulfatase-like hydrolase/transferase [Bacteroidales bacterium]|nr:MAG: sulfatase-like hydrolase/transferase [Bacteroidales bacterium]
MNQYLNHLIALFKRLIFLLLIFSLLRLYFFIFNYNSFVPGSFSGIIKAFLFGIRFDFIVVFYLNLPFVVLHFIPGNFKASFTYQRILQYMFVIISAFLLMANFIDVEYFQFTDRRSGTELIKLLAGSSETISLLPHYISGYWHITVSFIISVWILWQFYPKLHLRDWNIKIQGVYNIILQSVITILILGIFIGFARGLETKPIRINTAHKYATPKYIPLLFNTPFVIINTISQKEIINADYFDQEYAESIYSPVRYYSNDGSFKEQNVIIIILESFSKEYIGALNPKQKGFTPFLDSLISNSLVFNNALANSNRSMDALPAIISSLPPLDRRTFITSVYSTNKLESVSSLLKNKGYHTSFFHGGQNGTMGFDYYCKSVGIEEYYGENEYPFKGHHDGRWGIYDEHFFQFFASKLSEFRQPFISILFSLSSHDPYPIPKQYENKFPQSKLKILTSVAYTDYSLRRFFNTASGLEWYKNTLFVICPDHTSTAIENKYSTQIGRYKIPVIYYHPGDTALRGVNHNITQQIDILPTILDYLNFDKRFISFGSSVFSDESQKFWFCHNRGSYFIADSVYLLTFDGFKSIELFDHKRDSLLQSNIINNKPEASKFLEKKLKAILQNYQYRMERNLLTDTTGISMAVKEE